MRFFSGLFLMHDMPFDFSLLPAFPLKIFLVSKNVNDFFFFIFWNEFTPLYDIFGSVPPRTGPVWKQDLQILTA
jgi:hypothetical protein